MFVVVECYIKTIAKILACINIVLNYISQLITHIHKALPYSTSKEYFCNQKNGRNVY